MTREQVETILGEPQGGSGTYTWEDAYCIVRLRFDNEGHLCRVWAGEKQQKHVKNSLKQLLRRFGW